MNLENLRKAIREILAEDYRFQYGNKLFYPNQEMKVSCQKAIDAVTKNKLVGKGEAEGSGLRKAYDVINGKGMTHSQVKRMKAFFDNNHSAYKEELTAGRNISNSGLIQKWNLWGGDSGYRWSSKTLESHKSKNQKSKDNRAKGHKNMMDPTNTRTRTALSLARNGLKESYVDRHGNLIGFDPENREEQEENSFRKVVKKWDAGGRYVGSGTYEYWFPIEAESELNDLGVKRSEYHYDTATEMPWKGQKFIVYVANPKDWD